MTIPPLKREQKETLLGLSLLFVILFLLCRLFPLVGDDWYREALGANIHSPAELIREVAYRWSTTNSRIFANILAFSAGSRPLLRELYQTSFTLALIALLGRVTGINGARGLMLWTAAVLALPLPIFSQIHSWAAGFFVFVPPTVLLLGCLAIVQPVIDGGELTEGRLRWAALFIMGFLQELAAEHSALFGICAAGALLIWYRLERKKWSPSLISMLTGCVLGAALLFASPSYRLIGSGGTDYYKTGLTGGLGGLIQSAFRNLPTIARYFILDCPVLYWCLTLLTLLLGFRLRGALNWLLKAVLAAGCLSLALLPAHRITAAFIWALALAAALFLWLPDRISRARTLFFLFSALTAAGPLLFVNPIGPRCLLLSYVLLLAAAGSVLKALKPESLPKPATWLAPAALSLTALAVCFAVFVPIRRTELQRAEILEKAMASGAEKVTVPAYNNSRWLWDADSAFKLGQYYYHEAPGDVEISFEPGPQSK